MDNQSNAPVWRNVRRIKNEISVEEGRELLKTCRRGALSVNGDNGFPYVIPVNFYYDEGDDKIYIHSARKGHKIESIAKDNRVCFTTWDNGKRIEGDWADEVRSVVVFGEAEIVSDLIIKEDRLRRFGNKYYPEPEEVEKEIEADFRNVELISIKICHISAKKVQEK